MRTGSILLLCVVIPRDDTNAARRSIDRSIDRLSSSGQDAKQQPQVVVFERQPPLVPFEPLVRVALVRVRAPGERRGARGAVPRHAAPRAPGNGSVARLQAPDAQRVEKTPVRHRREGRDSQDDLIWEGPCVPPKPPPYPGCTWGSRSSMESRRRRVARPTSSRAAPRDVGARTTLRRARTTNLGSSRASGFFLFRSFLWIEDDVTPKRECTRYAGLRRSTA